MKSNYLPVVLAVCAAFLCPPAHAADMAGAEKPTKWLTHAEQLALTETVLPPPVPDDMDLATILRIQAARTPAMIAEAKLDQKFADTLFQPTYGRALTPKTSPKFYALMTTVLNITWNVNQTAKEKFKRLRPFKSHPDQVHALFDVDGYSYPSGHAMGSYCLATVLGAVFPDKAQAFLDRAALIAQSRVDAGVHYPSDIAEGQVLGKATGAAILANKEFQTDLAAVQAELKK